MRAVLLALPLLLLSLAAQASPADRERAQALVREGNRLLDGGDCNQALARFERALALYPSGYRIHVNLGSAYECLGDLPAAVTHFERFLLAAEPRRDSRMIGELRARFDRARVKVAGLRLRVPVDGALVSVDGSPIGRTPLPRTFYVQPGEHTIKVTSPDQAPFQETVQLAPGSIKELRVSWPARAAPSASLQISTPAPVVKQAASKPPIYKRWWFWTLIGVGVAGATVGGVLGARAGDSLPTGEIGTIDLGRP